MKAISADHCKIFYDNQKGWYMNEKGKAKVASNGTYMFLKSNGQLESRIPSDMLPLYDGMCISFINYELRVNFEPRSKTEVNALHYLTDQYFKERTVGSLGYMADLPLPTEQKDEEENKMVDPDPEELARKAALKNEKKVIKPNKITLEDNDHMEGDGPELADTGKEVQAGKVSSPEELLAEEIKEKQRKEFLENEEEVDDIPEKTDEEKKARIK